MTQYCTARKHCNEMHLIRNTFETTDREESWSSIKSQGVMYITFIYSCRLWHLEGPDVSSICDKNGTCEDLFINIKW